MNPIVLSIAALFGALTPLVVDSALKGAALLAVASLIAVALWRASAASRHLVWLVAVVALLVVPLFSLALPQWRVLPTWAALPTVQAVPDGTAEPRPLAPNIDETHGTRETALSTPGVSVAPKTAATRPMEPSPVVASIPEAPAALGVHEADVASSTSLDRRDGLAVAWAAGFTLLSLRILAAQLLLRRRMRGCEGLTEPQDESIRAAFVAACAQVGIGRRVALLLGRERSIPVVWGVFFPRIVLPAEAREWNGEQLRSVLLHELAHIRRRDTLVQWLTQIACALHWWNPLVWIAAWRLRTECERACDDFVLASGVRPSVYAEHLLHVATKLSPVPWTAACGLAMARNSSLEGRLIAVLSEHRNRRALSRALAAVAVLLGVAVAVPIAMLCAQDPAPAAEAPQESPASTIPELGPKHEEAKSLFETWRKYARENGDIPGALIGRLGEKVKEFVRNNTGDTWGDELAKRIEPLIPRVDGASDWTPADAVALLDEIAVISTIPIETSIDSFDESRILPGEPLPEELWNSPWGEPTEEGLRVAWILDPRAESYPIGTPLRSRILLCNSGTEPLVIRVPTWLQSNEHIAQDAAGQPIPIESTSWTTLARLRNWRLAPGEFCEIASPGIGVGKGAGKDEWADVRVGSWIDVADGVDVTFSPAAIDTRTYHGRSGGRQPETARELKLDILRNSLGREMPLPLGAADRERIARRVLREVFDAVPTPDEIAAFVADRSDDPSTTLSEFLLERAGLGAFSGELHPGEIVFRTTAADPEAENRPKVAISAGRYTLGDLVRLEIIGRLEDGERASDVQIHFWAADPKAEAPGKRHKITVPHGFGTWAITCRPGTGILWVLTRGAVRKVDFTDPARVKETSISPGSSDDVPDEYRESVRRVLRISRVPDEEIAELLADGAVDESSFHDAESQYEAGRWESAIAAYALALEDLPAGEKRVFAHYHKGEAHRALAEDPSLSEAKRARQLRAAKDSYTAVLAGTTVSSGPWKYLRWEPSEPAACFASHRLGTLAFAEGDASKDPAKYEEALGHFGIAAEIAANPEGGLGDEAPARRASSLYFAGKCQLALGRKKEAKDSFERVLGIEKDETFHDRARAELERLKL
jgi:beta-lactamase regulating signal transducer with metallopeptidase domain/tetratricopeptide (TPR) repeat protein